MQESYIQSGPPSVRDGNNQYASGSQYASGATGSGGVTDQWIYLTLTSAIFYTISNSGIVYVTSKVGPYVLFYQGVGQIATCTIYNLILCYHNYRKPGGKFWNDFNLIVDGKLQCKNLVGFCCFCAIIFLNQNLINVAIWTADLANLNAGVVTVIWSATPLF